MSLTPEQIKERRNYLTASDIPAVVGLSPWVTPYEIWSIKKGLIPQKPPTLQMDLGSAIQGPVIEVANKHLGLRIENNADNTLFKNGWCGATPDGFSGDDRIAEVKLAGKGKDWAEGVPDYVQCQIQWQMFCTGRTECIVLALVWSRLKVYEVQYSEELSKKIFERAYAFWSNHVIANVAPDVECVDAIEIPKQKNRQIIEIDSEDWDMHEAMDRYYTSKMEIELAKKVKDDSEEKIKHRIGEHGGVRCGKYLATWQADKRGRRRFNFKEE